MSRPRSQSRSGRASVECPLDVGLNPRPASGGGWLCRCAGVHRFARAQTISGFACCPKHLGPVV